MSTSLQFAAINDADAVLGLSSDLINFSLAGGNVLVSGVAGKKIYVFGIICTFASATTLVIKDGTTTSLTGTMNFTAGGSMVLDAINLCRWQTSTGNDFVFTTGSNSVVGGTIYYIQK